jgi:hypothetical protein
MKRRLITALWFALIAGVLQGQTFISIRGNTEASDTGANTSVNTSAGGTMNVATNDFIVAFIGTSTNSQAADGLVVSDGGSNTLTCDTASSGTSTGQLWMCYKAGATANATATWTATWTGTHAFRSIQVANYSGLLTASVLDQGPVCQNTANCTTEETGTTARDSVNLPTTTNANDMLVGGTISDNTENYSAANSFTIRGGTTGIDRNIMDKTVVSTGTYPSGSFATGSSTTIHFLTKFATFKVTTGGGGALLGPVKPTN